MPKINELPENKLMTLTKTQLIKGFMAYKRAVNVEIKNLKSELAQSKAQIEAERSSSMSCSTIENPELKSLVAATSYISDDEMEDEQDDDEDDDNEASKSDSQLEKTLTERINGVTDCRRERAEREMRSETEWRSDTERRRVLNSN
ncbi:hypothetical protein DAPPUDRAFT_118523 [Daphnia pulex]|uniref:Uncharacterized protein n=1 Tax=Daphnia pulex TaxID=6669 RepID=E9HVU8_DAPPU|nr:hypothetical protein DAPPUDRAFT_118523 [Daphnia pulex]|eukprot:EFX64132.1 hypothetical protein DAPPUDRAFT_118523 [Daphnia pulex]